MYSMGRGGCTSWGCTARGMHAVGSGGDALHGVGGMHTMELGGMHTTGMNAVGLGVPTVR